MRSILAWAILLAVATVGAQGMLPERSSGGWEQLSPERREIALVNQLGTMSLATETATLIRSGKTDQAIRLLEVMIDSSVEATDSLTRLGTRLPSQMPMPNLKVAPSRAEKYARANGLTEVADRAAVVAANLK